MISDALLNYISKDSMCILGLTTLEFDKSLFLISPLNKRYIYPEKINSSIESTYEQNAPLKQFNEWSKESSIYTLSSDEILGNGFITSNEDWNVSTALNLSPIITEESIEGDKQFSFVTTISFKDELIQRLNDIEITYTFGENEVQTETISLSKSEILNGIIDVASDKELAIKSKIEEIKEASFIQLFKQGSENSNGVIDCGLNLYKLDNEYFGELKLKIYYFNEIGTNVVNLQEYTYQLDNGFIKNFIDNFSMLAISLDSTTGIVRLYVNNNLINFEQLNLLDFYGSTLNYPEIAENNLNFIIGGTGTKVLNMRDFYVFNRILNPGEMTILSIFNKGNLVKYEDALTFMAHEANSSISLIVEGEIPAELMPKISYRTNYFDKWKTYKFGDEIMLENVGSFVQFKNSIETLSIDQDNYVTFVMNGSIMGSGNIQSMLNYIEARPQYCFENLFLDCNSLIKMPTEWNIID